MKIDLNTSIKVKISNRYNSLLHLCLVIVLVLEAGSVITEPPNECVRWLFEILPCKNSDVFIATGQHYSSYCRLNSSREIECSGCGGLVPPRIEKSFLSPPVCSWRRQSCLSLACVIIKDNETDILSFLCYFLFLCFWSST